MPAAGTADSSCAIAPAETAPLAAGDRLGNESSPELRRAILQVLQRKLKGNAANITGGDRGIGRAVALAYTREGAHVRLSYLNEESDAKETARVGEVAGRNCSAISCDIQQEPHCRSIVERAETEVGKFSILVNNAAFQLDWPSLMEIPSEEFDRMIKTNAYATFYLCQAVEPHMPKGGSIINTSSVNLDKRRPVIALCRS